MAEEKKKDKEKSLKELRQEVNLNSDFLLMDQGTAFDSWGNGEV